MKYNYLEAQTVAKKYKYKTDFIKNDNGYYRYAHRKGILNEICSHMEQKNRSFKYTKEMVYKELEKYEFLDEFIQGSYALYKFAFREKMLNEVKSILNTNVNKKWTKEKVLEEAKKYTYRSEFQQLSCGAYDRAKKDGYLEEACTHMKKQFIWTKDLIKIEAKKYMYKSDFHKLSAGAYTRAWQDGYLNEVCTHMKTKIPQNKIELYRNRKTILYYVKINNLWKIGVAIHEKYKDPIDTILKYRYGMEIKYGNVSIEIIDYKIYENGEYAYLNEQEILELNAEYKYTGDRILGCNKYGIIGEELKKSRETEIFTKNIYKDISYYFN